MSSASAEPIWIDLTGCRQTIKRTRGETTQSGESGQVLTAIGRTDRTVHLGLSSEISASTSEAFSLPRPKQSAVNFSTNMPTISENTSSVMRPSLLQDGGVHSALTSQLLGQGLVSGVPVAGSDLASGVPMPRQQYDSHENAAASPPGGATGTTRPPSSSNQSTTKQSGPSGGQNFYNTTNNTTHVYQVAPAGQVPATPSVTAPVPSVTAPVPSVTAPVPLAPPATAPATAPVPSGYRVETVDTSEVPRLSGAAQKIQHNMQFSSPFEFSQPGIPQPTVHHRPSLNAPMGVHVQRGGSLFQPPQHLVGGPPPQQFPPQHPPLHLVHAPPGATVLPGAHALMHQHTSQHHGYPPQMLMSQHGPTMLQQPPMQIHGVQQQAPMQMQQQQAPMQMQQQQAPMQMHGVQQQAPPQQQAQEPHEPPIMAGWLRKRGPNYGMDYKTRFFRLYRSRITYAKDEEGPLKGEIPLFPDAWAVSFTDPAATMEAHGQLSKKSFGIEVHTGGPNPRGRVWYLDAGNANKLQAWLTAIANRATASTQHVR